MAGIRAKRRAAETQARWAKWGAANSVATGHAAKAGRADSDAEPQRSKSDNASAAARAARRSGFLCRYAVCASHLWRDVWLLIGCCCCCRYHQFACAHLVRRASGVCSQCLKSDVTCVCACRWRDLQRMKRNRGERLMLASQD